MNYFRISKYNPKFRINGSYMLDDWTSFFDVGKSFFGKKLTLKAYEEVELNYIKCVLELFSYSNLKFLRIEALEVYRNVKWTNNQVLNETTLAAFIKDCLREKCWARLMGQDFFIHFGYDYYMYFGAEIDRDLVNTIIKKHNLFYEEIKSPYLD